MTRRTAISFASLLVLACAGKTIGGSDEIGESEESESDASDSATSDELGSSGESDADESEDSSETGLETCESQVSEVECEALAAMLEPRESCGWGFAYQCGGVPLGRCVSIFYQGDGCQAPGSCGASDGPNTYWQGDELLSLEACEYQPFGWTRCIWDGGDVDPKCDCACE